MTESLRKKIVFATLPLAVAWAVFNYPSKKTGVEPQVSEAVALTQSAALTKSQEAAAPTSEPTSAQPVFDVDARRKEPWGEDPFRVQNPRSPSPSGDRASASLSWSLAGIVFNEQNPMAFVNNRMVGVGDRVGLATVTAINRESVTLEYQGRTITLKLNKG